MQFDLVASKISMVGLKSKVKGILRDLNETSMDENYLIKL